MRNRVRLWGSHGSTVLGITLVLYMLGLLLCIEYHSYRLTHDAQERITYKVDLAPDVNDSVALAAKSRIETMDYVKQVDYISRDKAAEIFSEEMGEDFVDFIGYNPLYPSLMVNFRADLLPTDSSPVLDRFCKEAARLNGVAGVSYQENVVNELHEVFYKLSLFLVVFVVLLLLITIVLISSLIRIAIYAQRDTIRTMRMVGAKVGFIMRPFLWRSIAYGALGGVLASAFTVISLWALGNEFAMDLLATSHWLWYGLIAAAITFAGIIVAFLSTVFTVRHYISHN